MAIVWHTLKNTNRKQAILSQIIGSSSVLCHTI